LKARVYTGFNRLFPIIDELNRLFNYLALQVDQAFEFPLDSVQFVVLFAVRSIDFAKHIRIGSLFDVPLGQRGC